MPTLEQQPISTEIQETPKVYRELDRYLGDAQPGSAKLTALADYTRYLDIYSINRLQPTKQGQEALTEIMDTMAKEKKDNSGYALAIDKIVTRFDKPLFVFEAEVLGKPDTKPGTIEGAVVYANVAERLKKTVEGKLKI